MSNKTHRKTLTLNSETLRTLNPSTLADVLGGEGGCLVSNSCYCPGGQAGPQECVISNSCYCPKQ
jgi:hypothetical protein